LLAEARDLVPSGGAVDVAEVVRTVLLGFRCAHARVVARVVTLPHLRVGQLTAVRRLDALGKDMNVCAGGFQRAHDGARRCDDFAVPFTGEHADECSQLLLEWGAPGFMAQPRPVGGRLAPLARFTC
jgi:hypothetical protein